MEGTKTIEVENGELYVIDDKIVGRMETKGNVIKYYRGDKFHRDGDLPAYIERNDARCFASQSINGAVTCEVYYRDGVEFSKAEIKLTDELASEKATSLALREELAALKAKLLILIN